MSLLDNVSQFNQLANDLPALQGFIGVLQSGKVIINTDGNGIYWAIVPRYSPDTGLSTDSALIKLNITSNLSTAQAAIAALLPFVQNATISPLPGNLT